MKKVYGWHRYRPQAAASLLLLAAPALAPLHADAAVVKLADIAVSGRVVQPDGSPVPGATVIVKGSTVGASTNAEGVFSLNVPEGSTLVISAVGFIKQEVAVKGPTTGLNITLQEDMQALSEVVVVGYGTQKKGDVTSAIATMDARKLEERPIARVDQALVGQLAGVQVKQVSGVPGRAFSIQVRGAGSISAGNEPLYVIDGFPLETAAANGGGRFSAGSPLDNINPNDIEKIEVLKDAAAAAIYGSRAANGVVLITTKRGKTGKPQISLSVYAGASRAAKKLDLLNGDEWASRATEIINNNWVKSGANRTADQTTAQRRAILGLTGNNVNPDLMLDDRWAIPGHPGLRYVDWQDELYRTGVSQNYQVSAAGSTDNVNYYISGNYNDQQGFAIGLDYKRYSGRANVEVKASKKLKFGLNLNPTYSISVDPGIEGKDNRFHQILSETPIVEDTAGIYTAYGKNDAYRWGVSTASPIAVIKNFQGSTRTFRTLATVFAELQPIDGLRLRSTINFDNNDTNAKSYSPPTRNLATSLASGSYSGYRRQTFVNENTATYNKVIGKNDIALLAGQSYNFSKLDNVALAASGGFINNTVTTLNAATTITGTGSNFTTESQSVLLSYFGRVQYGFDSRYLLSASVRRDGSSRFGGGTHWGVFPAVSAGWRISQERFMEPLSTRFLSDLKLRGSLGYSGNNTIGDYSSIATLGFYNYTFGGNSGTQATGQAPNKVGNTQLKWERNRTFDYGLDMGLFKNRITASFDIYTKTSKDLLLNVPVPTASGFATNLVNIGEVQNKGWELELDTRNFDGAFSWTTSFNLSHNQNKVVHLGPGDATIEVPNGLDTPSNILRVGLPIYSIFVVKQDGILTQADIDAGAAKFGSETAGDPKYVDFNGDGKIDSNDRQVVGNPNPTYTFGMTNTLRYKGFDLSFLVQGQAGGSIYSTLGRAIDRTSVGYKENALGRVRDRWFSEENPGAGIKGKATGSFGFIRNTDWLYSSNYYRVRYITLGYDLGLLINKRVAQGGRIYVTAENWFGWDKYYGGLNPDALNTSNTGTFVSGSDYGGLPLAKTLVLGVNLSF